VFVRDGKVVQIEGDPDAPHSRGRLCPKGSASLQLTTGSARERHVLYRRPYGTEWERLDLETAMEMIVERVLATRAEGWREEHEGKRTRRCMSIASLGGATLDNEENYLIKKLFTSLGVVQIENQARVCHSSTVGSRERCGTARELGADALRTVRGGRRLGTRSPLHGGASARASWRTRDLTRPAGCRFIAAAGP
jgi:anaerobic selenocysteine-containing dehydrogenase